MLMLDFWLEGNLENWYIAGILLLYIITPLWIALWKKCHWVYAGTFLATLLSYIFLRNTPFIVHWSILLCRIPVYLLGIAFGKMLLEKRKFEVSLPLGIGLVLCGVGLILASLGRLPTEVPYAYKYIAYIPVSVGLYLMCAKIPPNKLTNYFGVRSLEIYLIFEKVQEILASKPQMEIFSGRTGVVLTAITLAVTLIGVELLRWICKLIDRILETIS